MNESASAGGRMRIYENPEDDPDHERSEAELTRRKVIVLDKIENYDDNNTNLIVKSKQKSLYL
jgi:hypothetical protein